MVATPNMASSSKQTFRERWPVNKINLFLALLIVVLTLTGFMLYRQGEEQSATASFCLYVQQVQTDLLHVEKISLSMPNPASATPAVDLAYDRSLLGGLFYVASSMSAASASAPTASLRTALQETAQNMQPQLMSPLYSAALTLAALSPATSPAKAMAAQAKDITAFNRGALTFARPIQLKIIKLHNTCPSQKLSF